MINYIVRYMWVPEKLSGFVKVADNHIINPKIAIFMQKGGLDRTRLNGYLLYEDHYITVAVQKQSSGRSIVI